ncbi:MAG: hypothetical protein QXS17_03635, partial [Candidatus Micrarchaeaceae archaeon]
IENKLGIFIEDLEREVSTKNKLHAKTAGMSMLTLAGIAFFFPLFSGIGLAILRSSGGLVVSSNYSEFAVVSMVYVVLMLYLVSVFSHPEENGKGLAFYIMPYAMLAFTMFWVAYSFVGFAI